MTKSIRIENACNSSYKVKVIAQCLSADGAWVDELCPEVRLNSPTTMTTQMIHSHRRLIVQESD